MLKRERARPWRWPNLRDIFALAAIAILTSGCTQLLGPGNQIPTMTPLSTGATLLPASNYHLVTLRTPPVAGATNNQIMCTEPSPDWASTLSTAEALSASGSAPGGTSASLAANASDTQAITAMLGRTAGVVALRDGLYSACQAYANGVIGRDSYALIISQYGDLLVQLAGGSTASPSPSSSPAPATTTPSSPTPIAVAVSTGPATPAPSSSTSSSSGTSQSSAVNPNVSLIQMETIQAMLVACIADADPSVYNANQNNLLQTKCPTFIDNLNSKVAALLTPAPPPSASPTPTKSAAPSPSPAVTALQTMLKAAGYDPGPIDGIDGPQTKAAYNAFQLKNGGKPAPKNA